MTYTYVHVVQQGLEERCSMSRAYKNRRKRFKRIMVRLSRLSVEELKFLLIDADDRNVIEAAKRTL